MPSGRASATPRRKDVHERALGLLAVRQRSRRELERRLLQAGFESEDVGVELDRLERVGLVDDDAFARAVVESRTGRRGESRRMVAGRLAQAGVSRDTAEQALEDLAGDEQVHADRLAAERARRLAGVDPLTASSRLYGALARRGYPPDVAREAVRRALAGETIEA